MKSSRSRISLPIGFSLFSVSCRNISHESICLFLLRVDFKRTCRLRFETFRASCRSRFAGFCLLRFRLAPKRFLRGKLALLFFRVCCFFFKSCHVFHVLPNLDQASWAKKSFRTFLDIFNCSGLSLYFFSRSFESLYMPWP